MKIREGKITILVSQDSTTIEIMDADANVTFAKVTLTPEQLSSALSRLSHTPCNIEVHSLDRIGKKMENETFSFEIPKRDVDRAKLLWMANEALRKVGKSEWVPDNYWGSQRTFFEKDGKHFAQTNIRRWI